MLSESGSIHERIEYVEDTDMRTTYIMYNQNTRENPRNQTKVTEKSSTEVSIENKKRDSAHY